MFTPRCSPRAKEFPWSVNFVVRRMVAELRVVKVAQFSHFGPRILAYFPHTKGLPRHRQKKYIFGTRPTAHWPTAYYIAEWLRFFSCGSQKSKDLAAGFSCNFCNLPRFSPMRMPLYVRPSVRPSVCLSVCLSHAGIVSKRLYISSIFLPSGSAAILVFPHQTGWQYSDVDPLTGASNARGMTKNHDFRPISRFISQIMQDRAIVTMEGK